MNQNLESIELFLSLGLVTIIAVPKTSSVNEIDRGYIKNMSQIDY